MELGAKYLEDDLLISDVRAADAQREAGGGA